ncbi:hypothetical protein B0H10DRAFT_590466 [Mycena sp. CBHHK59/15]|nr:hypothetical protein B0H10DRAFT_590466 [Mycena sp. CBHHK59/15]
MESACENVNCASILLPSEILLCSGFISCSKECQVASWRSHKKACMLHPPPSLAGIRLVVKGGYDADGDLDHADGGWDDEDGLEEDDLMFSALKSIKVQIEHINVPVGFVKFKVIDLQKVRRCGFFDCLDECSHELGKLALLFDGNGRLHFKEGCWRAADFNGENFMVYLDELVIEPEWRGKGLGTWLLPKLFFLEELKESRFIFAWPTLLNFLEPPLANGPFGSRTPAEQVDWIRKRDLIIKMFRKAGFRRLCNSDFFCLAKKSSHPSHSIPLDGDAPFEELPPATTEDERMRRFMASH